MLISRPFTCVPYHPQNVQRVLASSQAHAYVFIIKFAYWLRVNRLRFLLRFPKINETYLSDCFGSVELKLPKEASAGQLVGHSSLIHTSVHMGAKKGFAKEGCGSQKFKKQIAVFMGVIER